MTLVTLALLVCSCNLAAAPVDKLVPSKMVVAVGFQLFMNGSNYGRVQNQI